VIPLVDDSASVGALARGGAAEALATALCPAGSTARSASRLRDLAGGADRAGDGAAGATGLRRGLARDRGIVEAGNRGVDGAEADVGEADVGVGDLGLDLSGDTRGGGARAADGAELGAVDGVGRVEPEHVGSVVVPDGHDQDHGLGEGLAHLDHATLGVEVIRVAESLDALLAEGVVDGVALNAGDLGGGVGDDAAVLGVEALDL